MMMMMFYYGDNNNNNSDADHYDDHDVLFFYQPWCILAPFSNNNLTRLILSFWHDNNKALVWSVVAIEFTSAWCSNNNSTMS